MFSYKTGGQYQSDDNITAQDNLHALHAFFAKFPELKKRDFFVSGESYGGVYVPTLSLAILHDKTVDWNMQGLLVGNGVMSWQYMEDSKLPFLHGHGAISDTQYDAINAACAGPKQDLQKCEELKQEVDNHSTGLNMYDYYRDCYANAPLGSGKNMDFHALRQAPRPPHPSLGMNVPCIDSVAATAWLNNPDVKKALHVDTSPNTWAICTSDVNYDRNMNYFAPPIYAELQRNYRVLVYHGDTDMACDYIQGQRAIEEVAKMENLQATTNMEEWTITDQVGPQVAGWVTHYKSPKELTFLTVKGAGHMAPQWKPQASYTFFSNFVSPPKKDAIMFA